MEVTLNKKTEPRNSSGDDGINLTVDRYETKDWRPLTSNLVIDLEGRFPMDVLKAIRKESEEFSEADVKVLETIAHTDWTKAALRLSRPAHREMAAAAVVRGAPMIYGFANIYALAGHPAWESVRYINIAKGRPENQVGSLTTTREYIWQLFDWSKVPQEFDRERLAGLIDAINQLGPFGFRGPAAAHIPGHLVHLEEGLKTAQVITPGYACLSNEVIARAIAQIEEKYLFVTSVNYSHIARGTKEEPAHYKMIGIQSEFGKSRGFFLMAHDEEEQVRQKYARYLPMSTSILSFYKKALDENGQLSLVLERYGSMEVDDIRKILRRFGFGLVISEKARNRLAQRVYND
jgi:hypothetical protein